MTKTRFQPGTFLEVDDFYGGRKVVMVGRDGVTAWDDIDTTKVTPVVIHPVLKPVELGTLVFFVENKSLSAAAKRVMDSLRMRMDARQENSLFIMRMLWNLAPKVQGDDWAPDEELVQWAHQQAQEQEVAVGRLHTAAERHLQARQ
jgi:hypothetical protein